MNIVRLLPAVREYARLVVVGRIDQEVINNSTLPASIPFAVHYNEREDGK